MIISRTPHRVSFFGGGTDYPAYYLEHGGIVLGAAINKYSYINIRHLPPFFNHKHRIVYSKQENINTIDEIDHPSVRETMRFLNIDYGVSIHHDGDIPARSGMGSSSAFTVGLLNSFYALEGRMVPREKLMLDAIDIEQNWIKEGVGSQDQAFAAFGGLNTIEFLPGGQIRVRPVILAPDRLRGFESRLLLFFTGISRISSEVTPEQIQNTAKNKTDLDRMKELTGEAHSILMSGSLDDFGRLLNETWKIKRTLSKQISNSHIDDIYERAIQAGALGGKLLGAGGGGFVVFYVREEEQAQVKSALSDLLCIPFGFDWDGSRIIVYEPGYNRS